MADCKDSLLRLGLAVLRAYVEQADPSLFLSLLAPDVTWLGAGQDMEAEGRETVSAIFRAGQDQLIPCRMSHIHELARPLSDSLWLVQISSLMATDPSFKLYLQAYQRCAFIFRKKADAAWEIVYVNHSIAYEALGEKELFALSKGLHNFHRLKSLDPAAFTPQDKSILFRLIRQVFSPLPEKEKEVCILLSLFPKFSRSLAEFFASDPKILANLKLQIERNPFCVYEPKDGVYVFHPVFREYLQGKFQEGPLDWQKKACARAARWGLQHGSPDLAFSLARKAGLPALAFEAARQGGLAILYKESPARLSQLLHAATPEDKRAGFEGCCLLLLAIGLLASPRQAREEREILLASMPDGWQVQPREEAALHFLEALDSLPSLDLMLPAFERFFLCCRKHRLKLPRDYFEGLHRGVSGQLVLYYRRAGSLLRNTEQLQRIYDICGQTIEACDGSLWQSCAAAECLYLQGKLEAAEEIFTNFLAAPCRSLDEQERAVTALFIVPRIMLLQNKKDRFPDWKIHYKKLRSRITNSLMQVDLNLAGIFIRSLLEQSSPSLERAMKHLNSLQDFPSLQPMRFSTRHRLLLSMHKYHLVLPATVPQEGIPSPDSSQMYKIYDAVMHVIALDRTGNEDRALKSLCCILDEAKADDLYLPLAEHGFLLKELLGKAARQEKYAPFVKTVLSYSLTPAAGPSLEENELTPREQLIIRRVREGRTNREIAEECCVAEITIKKHLSQLYQRFKVRSRTELLHAIERM